MPDKGKFGFVTIIGKPNVGKSTLLNSLIGYKVAIATPKANTTRNQIKGIYNDKDSQIVFVDTPGFLESKNRLDEKMRRSITESLAGVDIVLFLIPFWKRMDQSYMDNVTLFRNSNSKKYLILTKIDKAQTKEEVMEYLSQMEGTDTFDKIIPISARRSTNLKHLVSEIKKDLPIDIKHYDDDQIHENSDEFYVSEIIREKVLFNLKNEIPHDIFVKTINIEVKPKIIKIDVEIVLDRENHKRIIIGHGGDMLKKIGSDARKELEDYFGKQIYLNIFVKVRKNWKNKESIITEITEI